MIYLDNAATTCLDDEVISAMALVMRSSYGNPSALYSIGREAHKLIENARDDIASLINADKKEIVFTSGGTESDNAVIDLVNRIGKKGESNVVVSCIEHHAILEPVSKLKRNGFEVRYLPVDEMGIVSRQAIMDSVDKNTVLVSIMFVNNEIGTIEPVQDLCRIVKSINPKTLFHTDAVQAVGHILIDVKKLNVDYLSASAHKFNGPKGVGFLYVKAGAISPSLILGGGQEFGARSGTENVAGIIGMDTALRGNIEEIDENMKKIHELSKSFLSMLDEKGICYKINGTLEERIPGNINLSIKDVDGEGLLQFLDLKGICVSTGSACNSKSKERSHVLTALGISDDRIDEAIRVTIGKNNRYEDLITLVDSIDRYLAVIGRRT